MRKVSFLCMYRMNYGTCANKKQFVHDTHIYLRISSKDFPVQLFD
jgi:hypothetical protein